MKHKVKYRPSSKVIAAKAPYQVNGLVKEIQDTVYNVSAKYLKSEGWDMSDIADYFVVDVSEAEPGVIRAEIRGELDYEELSGLCDQVDKAVAVKFDRDAYFEPVEPGIAEAFIRTKVEACSDVTASASSQFTMQDVQALIDDYGTKYFEAIPTSGGRELWFSVFDTGSYNIRIEDGKIIMISTDDPYDDVRIFRSLEDFRNYLEKQIAIGKQEADMNYSANASTEIKAYTFDETEDGWGTDVRGILDLPFARAEDLMYEVRNTIRGANTDCETVEDLADFIRQLASEFEEAADEIESL